MKIHLAKSAGFCFGVRRAINLAINTAGTRKNVRMLGDIVHNEDVIASIKKTGIKKIRALARNKDQTLLIRAHGTSRAIVEKALKLGYRIVDATCPMVREIHKIARQMEEKGRQIIIIGESEHDEVRGIKGQLKTRAVTIEPHRPLPARALKKIKTAAVVVQSTQNETTVRRVLKKIGRLIKDLKVFNTICAPTRIKQAEIKTLPLDNDVVIIIGSRASANTRRLFEIASKLNPRTHWVCRASDIRGRWFKNARSVGITAGASTPDETTQKVIARIRECARR